MADREELRTGTLGELADFLGLGREPIVEQGKSAVSIDELLGIVVVGGDFADAQVLVQFEDDFRQVVQPVQDFLPDRRAVVEIAGDQPINIVRPALLEGRAQAGIPHLAGVNRPDVQHIRATRQGVPAGSRGTPCCRPWNNGSCDPGP